MRKNFTLKECKICNSKKVKYSYSFEKRKYYRCENCGFVFQNPLPTITELKTLYSQEYFDTNYFEKNSKMNLRDKQYNLDKKFLIKHFKDSNNKKILDYGCGNGKFLTKFKSKKYGYEFNKSAKVARSVKRITLKKINNLKFDLIIMRGVIEHIIDFDKVVERLSKKLKKGGFFYITATPNTNNLTFFLSNKDFNQNHFGHIYHFNNVNLSMFFLKNNLFNIETIYQYSETPYSNYLKDYKFSKIQLKNYERKTKKKTKSPAGVGNMMTLLFKKIV